MNSATIEWVVGDAQRHRFQPLAADAVLSRLGIMFFDGFTAALANLAGAVKPGGRFAAVVWLPKDRSPLHFRAPKVAADVAAAHGWPIDLGAPDARPFGFATDATRDFVTPQVEPLLIGAPEGVQEAVDRAIARDLHECWDGTGVRLDAMVAVVTARRA